MIKRILESEKFSEYDLSSLKKVLGGGEPSTPELVREVYKKIGCTYINEFGMTEGLVCRTALDDDVEVICNTVGKSTCPYNSVKILDDHGQELARNTDGELMVKGPAIFAGYVKNPEENRKSFTNHGYFRTGDMARIDDQGNLKITGRIKDLIIRGGENVSPAQVEELVGAHPGVADVAVIGMPDKELGERVCAYVRPVAGQTLNEKELQAFMESKGASKLLIPEKFVFVDSLPMTEAGKHDKKALREDIKRRLEARSHSRIKRSQAWGRRLTACYPDAFVSRQIGHCLGNRPLIFDSAVVSDYILRRFRTTEENTRSEGIRTMSELALKKGKLSSALRSRFRDYYVNMPGVDPSYADGRWQQWKESPGVITYRRQKRRQGCGLDHV